MICALWGFFIFLPLGILPSPYSCGGCNHSTYLITNYSKRLEQALVVWLPSEELSLYASCYPQLRRYVDNGNYSHVKCLGDGR